MFAKRNSSYKHTYDFCRKKTHIVVHNRMFKHRPPNVMQFPTQIRSQLILNNAKPELWNRVKKKRTSPIQLKDHKKIN